MPPAVYECVAGLRGPIHACSLRSLGRRYPCGAAGPNAGGGPSGLPSAMSIERGHTGREEWVGTRRQVILVWLHVCGGDKNGVARTPLLFMYCASPLAHSSRLRSTRRARQSRGALFAPCALAAFSRSCRHRTHRIRRIRPDVGYSLSLTSARVTRAVRIMVSAWAWHPLITGQLILSNVRPKLSVNYASAKAAAGRAQH